MNDQQAGQATEVAPGGRPHPEDPPLSAAAGQIRQAELEQTPAEASEAPGDGRTGPHQATTATPAVADAADRHPRGGERNSTEPAMVEPTPAEPAEPAEAERDGAALTEVPPVPELPGEGEPSAADPAEPAALPAEPADTTAPADETPVSGRPVSEVVEGMPRGMQADQAPPGAAAGDDSDGAIGPEAEEDPIGPEAAQGAAAAEGAEGAQVPEGAEGAEVPEGAAAAQGAEVLEGERLRSAVEAILFVVDRPTTTVELAQVLDVPRPATAAALAALRDELDEQQRGFELREVAGGWRLYTREEFAPYVERYVLDGQQARLTQAALETLAVVAYRQPVTRSRISAIRGVSVDGVIRTLLSRGLIEECGSEPDTGGLLYRTTPLFLEKLGLQSLEELPSLAPLLPELEAVEDVAPSS